jgi:hypothetical protein
MGLHCELFDSNSRFLSKLRDDDNSEGFRFYTGDCEEQYPSNPFSEHTLNFMDLQHRLLSAHPPPLPLLRALPSDPEEPDCAPNDMLYKRGLKSLASLLLKSFFKRRFSSLGEVIREIESQLLPSPLHSSVRMHPSRSARRSRRTSSDASTTP